MIPGHGPGNYLLPVMIPGQCGWVPRKENTIIDDPGEALQAIHIVQIHPHSSLAMGVMALLRFAPLLRTVEKHEGQNLVDNDSLPIKVISAYTPEDMEKFIKCVQQHFRV